ncbi:MAG TPA: hypothetical protein VIV60_34765 [Polyangiaceae bacterium]
MILHSRERELGKMTQPWGKRLADVSSTNCTKRSMKCRLEMASRISSPKEGNPVAGPNTVERADDVHGVAREIAGVSAPECNDAVHAFEPKVTDASIGKSIDDATVIEGAPDDDPIASPPQRAAPDADAVERGATNAIERAKANVFAFDSCAPNAEPAEHGRSPLPFEANRRRALVVPPLRLDLAGHANGANGLPPEALQHADWSNALDVRNPSKIPREVTETGLGPVEPPRTSTLKSASRVAETNSRVAMPRSVAAAPYAVRTRRGKLPQRVAILLVTALLSLGASVGVAALGARIWRRVSIQQVTPTRSIFLSVPSPESNVGTVLTATRLDQAAPAATSAQPTRAVSVAIATPPALPTRIDSDGLSAAVIPNKSPPKTIPTGKQAGLCPCNKPKKRSAIYDDLPTTDGPLP